MALCFCTSGGVPMCNIYQFSLKQALIVLRISDHEPLIRSRVPQVYRQCQVPASGLRRTVASPRWLQHRPLFPAPRLLWKPSPHPRDCVSFGGAVASVLAPASADWKLGSACHHPVRRQAIRMLHWVWSTSSDAVINALSHDWALDFVFFPIAVV